MDIFNDLSVDPTPPVDEFDFILSQVSDDEIATLLNPTTSSDTHEHPQRFAAPISDADVQEARKSAVPKNTAKNTTWAVKVWQDWRTHRFQIRGSPLDCPPHLLICSNAELDNWLCKFILEVRRQDGQPYPPQTLYGLACSIMRYVREVRPHVNFFKDADFDGFKRTLDGEMKRLRSTGLGVRPKRAEPITVNEENLMWEKGLLGSHSPQVLLHTMVYLCGLNFALRSGQEHRDLQLSQIELVEHTDQPPYLVYTENISKNNRGGLEQRKMEAKQVVHHSNTTNPDRCFVTLFKKYVEHCPTSSQRKTSAFYLTPIRNPRTSVWYSTTPVGHNTLNQTVKQLCKQAGIPGFKTNHSLRVTSATRLFQSGMDEQLIMSRTGHRSVQGVRTYKRISDDQKQTISSVLNATTNGQEAATSIKQQQQADIKLEQVTPDTEDKKIQIEGAIHHDGLPPMHFTGCSSITINIKQ